MISLLEVKNFIRATDEDDALVSALMNSAKSYLATAIDNYETVYESADDAWKAKADLALEMLVADWYENRTPTARPVASSIQLLITQLQLDGVSNENS